MRVTLNGRIIPGRERGERLTITTNHRVRELVSYNQLPANIQSDFDYMLPDVTTANATVHTLNDGEWNAYEGELDTPRFVQFRGSWYDTHKSERASDDFESLGWDSWQTESYFSAVLFRWFDVDGYELDGVIVGYAHW